MARLVILGSGSVFLCIMGHNVTSLSPFMIILSLLSIGGICLTTFIPAFLFTEETLVISASPSDDPEAESKTGEFSTRENMHYIYRQRM